MVTVAQQSSPSGEDPADPSVDLRIFTVATADAGARLTVHGAVDVGTAGRLRATLSAAIVEHNGPLVVDLADMTFGGAACLNALVEARATLHAQDRHLRIINPPPCFRRALAVCRLEDLTN